MTAEELQKTIFHDYVDCNKDSILALTHDFYFGRDKGMLQLIHNKTLNCLKHRVKYDNSQSNDTDNSDSIYYTILTSGENALDLETILELGGEGKLEEYESNYTMNIIHRNIDALEVWVNVIKDEYEDDNVVLVAPPDLQEPPFLDMAKDIPVHVNKKDYRQVQKELFGVCRPNNLEKRYSASRIRKILREKYNCGYEPNTHYKYGRANSKYSILYEARQHYRITDLNTGDILIKRIYNHEIGKVLEENGDY